MSMAASSCNSKTKLYKYYVGFSTPSSNEIWVDKVIFDGKWTTPVGTMSCCWESAHVASFINGRPLPKNVFVQWLDKSENVIFKASIKLDSNYEAQAESLPNYTVNHTDKEVEAIIYIIIGMGPNGMVTVWLSNAVSWRNNTGRVLNVIGQKQAVDESGH